LYGVSNKWKPLRGIGDEGVAALYVVSRKNVPLRGISDGCTALFLLECPKRAKVYRSVL